MLQHNFLGYSEYASALGRACISWCTEYRDDESLACPITFLTANILWETSKNRLSAFREVESIDDETHLARIRNELSDPDGHFGWFGYLEPMGWYRAAAGVVTDVVAACEVALNHDCDDHDEAADRLWEMALLRRFNSGDQFFDRLAAVNDPVGLFQVFCRTYPTVVPPDFPGPAIDSARPGGEYLFDRFVNYPSDWFLLKG
jgi:hypothetical protein